MIALLLLIAAAPQSGGAHFSGTATAHILPGVRIRLGDQQVQDSSAQPQRTHIVRQDSGQSQSLRLIEFQ